MLNLGVSEYLTSFSGSIAAQTEGSLPNILFNLRPNPFYLPLKIPLALVGHVTPKVFEITMIYLLFKSRAATCKEHRINWKLLAGSVAETGCDKDICATMFDVRASCGQS